MRTLKQQSAGLAMELGAQQSARLIEQALRRKATVVLEPRDAEPAQITGQLQERRGESLLLLTTQELDIRMLRSRYCDGRITDVPEACMFTTHVLDLHDVDGGRLLEVACPEILQLLQRRRFARAAVASSTAVFIVATRQGEAQQLTGTLLNASPAGLACRVDVVSGDACSVGDHVQVTFSLEGERESITMPACIRSKTPSAADAALILGLELMTAQAEPEQVEKLRNRLQNWW